jgi:hypothetical protein
MNRFVNLINMLNQHSDILNRSFNDQGGCTKPCSASFINDLEKVIVTNEDVDNGLCCAICQDYFKMGERTIKLPCKDPHYFHCDTSEDICGGILPWLEDNNSCPICREEFPEEEVDPENTIPVPDENFDEVNASNTNQSEQDVNEAIDDIIQRLFTIRPITDTLPPPDQPLPPINLRHTIYIPLVLPEINHSDENDPELQEAIRQSLINT